ncbi:MAG: M6 family metalloprotease domain-containing protein, partial [Gemmatimonadota bacterium]
MLKARIRPLLALMTPVALVLSGALLTPCTVSAQTDVEMVGRMRRANPPPGFYRVLQRDPAAFRFSRRNGWIRRGEAVAAERRRRRDLMVDGTARSDARAVTAVAAAMGVGQAPAVSGTLHMPVFPVLFENTDSSDIASNVPRAVLQARLYGTDPAPPYSMHTYYRELSNDQMIVSGTVFEWARVPLPDSIYEGNSNGLGFDSDMPQLLSDIVSVWDATVDFGQFDNDGPDGVPNSGDDDGRVDALVLIHPKVDGSCGGVNPEGEKSIWAHRYAYSTWTFGDSLVTGDARFGGGSILVDDYIVQGGQGGDAGCTSDEPLAFGLVAHETGHLFGLPDLYNTSNNGPGIGRWGLMGMGLQQTFNRPTHMTAWTKAELGWITEVTVATDSIIDVSPVVTSDTSYIVPIIDTNEYFILEN